jgi:hypothetical protein
MELKVSLSARVIIQEGKVNVNEILQETGKFGDLLKESAGREDPAKGGIKRLQ